MTYKQDPNNANRGTPEGREAVRRSLQRLRAGRSIVVDKEGYIIAGNKTYSEWDGPTVEVETDGSSLVVVKRRDLDLLNDPEAQELSIADNRSAELGLAWDIEALEERLTEESSYLFDASDLKSLRDIEASNRPPVSEDSPVLLADLDHYREKWGTADGQLWQLGPHMLLIGSSTTDAILPPLQASGRVANLLFTSPPYWLGKEYESEQNLAEIDNFVKTAVQAWMGVIAPDNTRVVINTGLGSLHRIDKHRPMEQLLLVDKWTNALREQGWLLRHLRIWNKHSTIPKKVSRKADFMEQRFEHLALYTHDSIDWDYLATFYSPTGDQRGRQFLQEPWPLLGIWDDLTNDPYVGGKHVAAFPLELPERYIRMYTGLGELVFDPFSGSGTTILAAHRRERVAYGVERDPRIAAAALERFHQTTGIEPYVTQT